MEERIQPAETVPQPSWVMSPPMPSDGIKYYVGIAVVENVLEEHQGRRRALTNAQELIAQSIATDVEARVVAIDTTEGAAHKGQDEKKAKIVEEVKAKTNEIVRGMNPKEYYYEQWKMRNSVFSPMPFKRYKYYVLCAYPQAEYDRLVKAVGASVK